MWVMCSGGVSGAWPPAWLLLGWVTAADDMEEVSLVRPSLSATRDDWLAMLAMHLLARLPPRYGQAGQLSRRLPSRSRVRSAGRPLQGPKG
jgi:hypothetical protein